MADRVWVFDCHGRDVPPVMVVHARCLEIAVREARHRFERIWTMALRQTTVQNVL